MRVAIIGQQDFGKAALDAFLARGDDVAAVCGRGALAEGEALSRVEGGARRIAGARPRDCALARNI